MGGKTAEYSQPSTLAEEENGKWGGMEGLRRRGVVGMWACGRKEGANRLIADSLSCVPGMSGVDCGLSKVSLATLACGLAVMTW